MNIGSIIKELRQKKKMSQEELAENLGVSTQAVSRWETGVSYPDITLLPFIANVFSVTTDYLLSVDKVTNDKIADEVKKRYYNEYLHQGNNVGGYNYMKEMIDKYPFNEEIQILYVDACFAVGNYDKGPHNKGLTFVKN